MTVRAILMAAAGQVGPPDAPTIGTATAISSTTATVSFTAPGANGSPITSYTATSSPGGITATLTQAGSGTITVSGLNPSTAYTFTVKATNAKGTSLASAASNSINTPAAAWSLIKSAYQPYSLDGSANGQFLVYFDTSSASAGLYRSADYGVTWTKIASLWSVSGTPGPKQTTYLSMMSCVISDNGQVIITLAKTGSSGPYGIMRSTDGGTTWAFVNPANRGPLLLGIYATPDCSIIYGYIPSNPGDLYRSFDYGSTWDKITYPNGSGSADVSCSDNGAILVSSDGNGTNVSGDYGVTWTLKSANYINWKSYISGNGAVMILINGYTYAISTNSGTTWATRTIATTYSSIVRVSLNYTGSTIIMVTTGNPNGSGGVIKSTDSGLTWADLGAPGNAWIGVAINSNATQIVAATNITYGSNPGTLWIYQ